MEKKNTHMIYGLVTGLAMVVLSLVLHVADLSFEPWAQYTLYAPFIAGVLLNAVAFSKENDHYVTFGNVFSSCFKACAIITLVVLAWSLASVYIFPEIKERGLEMAREGMAKNPQMTDEQLDQAIEMTKKYFTVGLIMGVVFGYMFFGAVFSLLGAAIAKKKGNTPQPL